MVQERSLAERTIVRGRGGVEKIRVETIITYFKSQTDDEFRRNSRCYNRSVEIKVSNSNPTIKLVSSKFPAGFR